MKKIALISLSLALSSVLMADSFSKTISIKTLNSEPVFETISEYIPVESCQDVREDVKQNDSGSGIVGGLLGAVAGGVIGNQFGGGSGKKLATVGGALVGGITGNNLASSKASSDGSYQVIRRCSVQQIKKDKQVISGYLNKGLFEGKEISTYSRSPLSEIPIAITYSY